MERSMLPPPLMVSEPGSFAESTIRTRKPQIIATVIATNDYPPAIVAALHMLADEIANRQQVQPLASWPADQPWWRDTWVLHQGKTWFELPWYFAEAYFYRRLLSAVEYDVPGPWHGHDPFAAQKHASLPAAVASLEGVAPLLDADLDPADATRLSLRRSLWGNRADLSNQTVAIDRHHYAGEDDRARLLVDDTPALYAHLASGDVHRLDLVADNSGPELCSDLVLLDYLLRSGLIAFARLHLKRLPFFVSDAMVADAFEAITALSHSSSAPVQALAARLAEHLASGRLALRDHGCWASPLLFSALPGDLATELAASDLLLLKGDANYRRVLEDRHWPPTTSLGVVTGFMPTSFAVLRTLKSELVVGLAAGQAEALATQDPTWLIDGERGVIQLVWRR